MPQDYLAAIRGARHCEAQTRSRALVSLPAFLYTFCALQSHITTVTLDFGGVLGWMRVNQRVVDCVFLDDYPVNVEGTRAAGINAFLFRSGDVAAAELRNRWGLPVQCLVDGVHA